MQHQLLHIAVPAPLRKLFDYLPIPSPIDYQPGMRVLVPFGRKAVVGIIVAMDNHSDVNAKKLKRITRLLDDEPLFSASLLKLLMWAADYYHYPVGEVLHQALPPHLRGAEPALVRQETFYQLTQAGKRAELSDFKKAPRQWEALETLRDCLRLSPHPFGVSQHEANARLIKPAFLKQLISKKIVETIKSTGYEKNELLLSHPLSLIPTQENAVNTIWEKHHVFNCFVLYGVTGSGKTEVYLNVVQRAIEQGRQALILIPEIGLSPQTLSRFKERLGTSIGVLHSGLTDRERTDTWLKAKNGSISVIIGTRSAIFTDFSNLGVIVVDEAHDASYKQWEGFKYHARDLAVRRAQNQNIPVILGSATPSISTLAQVWQGHYQLLNLPHRIGDAQLPPIRLIDCRRIRTQHGLVPDVIQQVQKTIQRGEQVLFFLNRRGVAPALLCQECGWVSQCQRCERPMTLHSRPEKLLCHHCEKSQRIPSACPTCKHASLINLGLGTQGLEQGLAELFPGISSVRIDRDSTRKKGSLDVHLQAIHSGQAQLLIGTQMLAKGHHFPNVTLVVMLDIDGGLYSADFTATENLAQQIVQVAGRAGRAEKPGQVLIQTYHPDHPLLQTLLSTNYITFAEEVARERKSAACPPYAYYVLVSAEAVNKEACEIFLTEVRTLLAENATGVRLLGPLPAPIEKLAGRYRWQLLLTSSHRQELHRLLKQQLPYIEGLKSIRKVRWSIDVDPIDLL